MTNDLLSEVLKLPKADRIRIANALYESCATDPRDWLDQSQLHEIERRSADVDAGTADLVPAEDVFREIRSRLAP